MVVPSTHCVSGSSKTSRMTKGTERTMLTRKLPLIWAKRFAQNNLRLVTCSKKPSGRPMAMASTLAMPTIRKVSPKALTRSVLRDDQSMSMEDLYVGCVVADELHGINDALGNRKRGSGGQWPRRIDRQMGQAQH